MPNKKILIVDDETQIVEILSTRLRLLGYHVLTAFDGESALEVAELERPDLILLDIRMPKMDGHAVCRSLRSSDGYRNIKIFMVTACESEEDRQQAMQNGANDFITKPLQLQELCGKIQSLFAAA